MSFTVLSLIRFLNEPKTQAQLICERVELSLELLRLNLYAEVLFFPFNIHTSSPIVDTNESKMGLS